MKKLISILVLAVFIFNVGGYYFFFWAMKYTANQQLEQRLDANMYSSEEVIELKVPFTLPYPIFNNGFERVDGKFEYNGEIFKLVKQQLVDDTLHIICIKNITEKEIRSAFKTYSKLSNDLPLQSGKHSSNLLSKLIKDYDQFKVVQMSLTAGWCQTMQWIDISGNTDSPSLDILAPPPKV